MPSAQCPVHGGSYNEHDDGNDDGNDGNLRRRRKR